MCAVEDATVGVARKRVGRNGLDRVEEQGHECIKAKGNEQTSRRKNGGGREQKGNAQIRLAGRDAQWKRKKKVDCRKRGGSRKAHDEHGPGATGKGGRPGPRKEETNNS